MDDGKLFEFTVLQGPMWVNYVTSSSQLRFIANKGEERVRM